jgi:hypothetical protein
MALTHADHIAFTRLKAEGQFPPRPSVIELGEAVWDGAVATEILSDDIENLVKDERQREELHQRMAAVLCGDTADGNWDLAKIFYQVFLDYRKITAIDLHGTAAAHKLDLNHPLDLGEQFDVLINSGTAEHVFNVFQFFKTSHELVAPGGVMVHTMPFRGWLEHGFYSFNPTFFWDVAAANDYQMLVLAYTELSPPSYVELTDRRRIIDMARNMELGYDALLYAVMKKPAAEAAFRIPMQDHYARIQAA